MAVINMKHIVNSYYRAINKTELIGLPDHWYNFGNVNIHLKDESLGLQDTQNSTLIPQTDRKSKTKVIFEKKNPRGPAALAMLRATDQSICSGRIVLTSGVITGLNDSLITLSLGEVGLQQFGDYIHLDLSRPVCYDEPFEKPAPEFDEIDVSGETTAYVYCTEEKRKGLFEFEVIMTGWVTIIHGGRSHGIDIATAVAELGKRRHESVQGLRSDGQTVEFTVKGEMDFRRPGNPEIEWQ